MNTTLALGIIVIVIEIADFLIKKFAPSWKGAIPTINLFIGFVGGYVFKIDIAACLAASGTSMAAYDTIKGIMKFWRECTN